MDEGPRRGLHGQSHLAGRKGHGPLDLALDAQRPAAAGHRHVGARAPFARGWRGAESLRGRGIGVLRPDDFVGDGFFRAFLRHRLGLEKFLGPGAERRLQWGQGRVDRLHPFLLLRCTDKRQRTRSRHVAVPHPVGESLEDRPHRIVFALRQRVEFVVVARGAARGESEPDLRRRVEAVGRVACLHLVLDRAALGRREMIAVVTRGDELIEPRVGQHVASELLDGELVEGQVAVEGLHDPVAVGPDVADVVEVEAVGVAVAYRIQPEASEMFAEAGGGQQARDGAVVGIGRLVREKRVELWQRGRQPRQIQRQAPQQRRACGGGGEGEAARRELGTDETIHRVGIRPGGGRRHRRTRHGLVGPVALVNRALFDPALDEFALFPGQRLLVRVGRRHRLVGIRARDALPQFRIRQVTRHDGAEAVAVRPRAFRRVEPPVGLAVFFILPVARETVVRKDRPDVFVERHLVGREAGEREGGENEEGG